jgi:hypothetical protein
MSEKMFETIFKMIRDYLPEKWEKVIFFAGYTEGSYSMKYYVKNQAGEYEDCFHLLGLTRPQLIQLFMKIDKTLSAERASLDETKRWTVFTMSVEHDGKIKSEFDYGDHSEDLIAYENEWKKKYLCQ